MKKLIDYRLPMRVYEPKSAKKPGVQVAPGLFFAKNQTSIVIFCHFPVFHCVVSAFVRYQQ